jgi:CII-binding regulator of phage lambda lysogenization HflD|tara:strand:+ start:2958 stop:3239 length:282 start_codon:yes stop_codon:yes gene_type:complete
MDYPVIASIVRDLGFPIVVALFVLLRLNGSLDKLKVAIDNLSHEMQDRDESLVKLTSKVDMLERTVYRLNKRKRQVLNKLASKEQHKEKDIGE